MKKFVTLNVFFSTEKNKPLLGVSPNISFIYDFDDCDGDSLSDYRDKIYNVESIVRLLRKLDCIAYYEVFEKYRPEVI